VERRSTDRSDKETWLMIADLSEPIVAVILISAAALVIVVALVSWRKK